MFWMQVFWVLGMTINNKWSNKNPTSCLEALSYFAWKKAAWKFKKVMKLFPSSLVVSKFKRTPENDTDFNFADDQNFFCGNIISCTNDFHKFNFAVHQISKDLREFILVVHQIQKKISENLGFFLLNWRVESEKLHWKFIF